MWIHKSSFLILRPRDQPHPHCRACVFLPACLASTCAHQCLLLPPSFTCLQEKSAELDGQEVAGGWLKVDLNPGSRTPGGGGRGGGRGGGGRFGGRGDFGGRGRGRGGRGDFGGRGRGRGGRDGGRGGGECALLPLPLHLECDACSLAAGCMHIPRLHTQIVTGGAAACVAARSCHPLGCRPPREVLLVHSPRERRTSSAPVEAPHPSRCLLRVSPDRGCTAGLRGGDPPPGQRSMLIPLPWGAPSAHLPFGSYPARVIPPIMPEHCQPALLAPAPALPPLHHPSGWQRWTAGCLPPSCLLLFLAHPAICRCRRLTPVLPSIHFFASHRPRRARRAWSSHVN